MMKLFLIALVVVLAATMQVVTAQDDGPIVLTEKNFKEVVSGPKIALVAFTAPWCGHCKRMKPGYALAATALSGIATVANVDADGEGRSLGSKFGVQGFPTIKVFGASKKKPTDYEGERSAVGLVRGVMDEIEKAAMIRIGK